MSVALREGSRVGAYELGERIGAGASSVVFEGRGEDGSRVALKVLREDVAVDGESRARMEREAKVLSSLDHEAIVKVRASGTLEDGRPWIAMDRVEGSSLRRAIDDGLWRADATGAWSQLRPVCQGLAIAHERGVVHRDVKPENILIDGDGRAKLVDFGLARAASGSSLAQPTLTGPGAALGTPPYMAPELWWNADVTARVDQYAIACTLFELLCGQTPFVSQSFAAWMEAHLHEAIPSVSSLLGERLPDARRVAIDAFFARALAKDASDRFESMEALVRSADEAFGFRAESTSNATASDEPSQRRRWAGALRSLAPMWVAVSALLFLWVGHGGTRSIRELCRLAGWGIYPTVASIVAAFVLALFGRSPRIAAMSATGFGLFGAMTGWTQVLRAVGASPAEARFVILHEGLYEADVNRAVGYWGAWGAVCAALSLGPTRPAPRRSWPVLGVMLFVAVALAVVGAHRASLVLALSAIAAWLCVRGVIATKDEALGRGALALAGVLAAMGACAVSLGAEDAGVWRSHVDRAERVARLTALSREESLLVFASSLAVLASVVLGAMGLRARPWRSRPTAAFRALLLPSLAVLSLVGMDGWLRFRVHAARSTARAAITGQFALFSRLEVPFARGLSEPHVGPSVQLAEDVVAIDGRAVLRVSALDGAVGRSTLASDLSHRFALERQAGAELGPRWTLAVDRRSPWARVRRLLEIARDAGGGTAELLFARSANPRWTVWAPPESSLVVPRDYGALELCPSDQGVGVALDDRWPYSTVAERLLAALVDGGCVSLREPPRSAR